jgi:chromate transporter
MTEEKKVDLLPVVITPNAPNNTPDVEAPSKPSSSVDFAQNGQQPPLDPTATTDGLPTDSTPIVLEATWKELIYHWFILGWTAFGGPAAHVAMFQKLFVDKLKWCTYLVFTELLMLGQCVPGPTSTQMGFALGVLKKGLSGGLVSGILFQGPGLLILAILGWVAARYLDSDIEWLSGLVAGLAAAGIALVASASAALTKNICKTKLLQVIATAAAVIAYYYPKPWTFPAVIIAGGIITVLSMRKDVIKVAEAAVGVDRLGFNKLGGALLIALWIAVLVATIVTTAGSEYLNQKELHWFAAFYRTGSVIFGGGQVVLPMLYNDVVAADCLDQARRCCPVELNLDMATNTTMFEVCDAPDADLNPECKCSWMSGNQFYAGLAISQAMPGPLFNFAAYLGAVIAQNAGVFAIAGIAICWIALFSPGIILIFAILPFWGSFRKWQFYRRALPGLNSAAVGLIIASVFQLTLTAYISSPFPKTSICIGIIAFAATDVLNIWAPVVVVFGGLLGVLGWGADMV